MYKLITIGLLLGGLTSAYSVDCAKTPVGMELAKSIQVKDVDKAKTLLKAFKADVQAYLEKCDKNKEKFEETSIMILTYEDRLADVEADMNSKPAVNVDCSKSPDSKAVEEAFKSADASKIKVQYSKYKAEAESYLEHCASHEEYEFVFEESLLHEEAYAKWEKTTQ